MRSYVKINATLETWRHYINNLHSGFVRQCSCGKREWDYFEFVAINLHLFLIELQRNINPNTKNTRSLKTNVSKTISLYGVLHSKWWLNFEIFLKNKILIFDKIQLREFISGKVI